VSGSTEAAIIAHPAARRRRHREETIEAILSAARAVMRKEGVAGLNLQEVARRVGVRAPSLYEYFPQQGGAL
jgi:AcrR family transcriptional regulator